MYRKVTLRETVELFINMTVNEIMTEWETPRCNIIFKEEAYDLFYDIMNNPFKIDGWWTPNIKEEDIDRLRNMKDYECPTLYVKDHLLFFNYLTDITNNLIVLYDKYDEKRFPRQLVMQLMRRIWLRMGPNDFNNVEKFLHNQLEFSKNDIFEEYKKEKKINEFHGYNVIAECQLNSTYDETTKGMNFKIYDQDKYHSLPHIYYDIIDDICYIYAIQNDFLRQKIPAIEKLIYKLYRGNGQPSMVYTMKLFIELLKEKNISIIKVPIIQVLSYRYHELLSEKTKERFNKDWNEESLERIKNLKLDYKIKKYENDKKWYNNVVNKQELISKLKTENLINLIYRIISEDETLFLTNDIDIDDTLNIKIKKK